MASIGIKKNYLYINTTADKCPHCQQISEIELSVTQDVFVLALPLFPTTKGVEVCCTRCENQISFQQAPKFVKDRYFRELPSLKTPWRVYSGSILFGFIFLVALIYMPFHENELKKMINEPVMGDIYEIEVNNTESIFGGKNYTIWRVDSVKGSTVFFTSALYETGKQSNLYKIKEMPDDELWGYDVVIKDKDELTYMLSMDALPRIVDIERH